MKSLKVDDETRAQAVYDAAFPAPDAGTLRRKRILSIGGTALFAALLCAAALLAGWLGLGGMSLSLASPKSPSPVVGEKDINVATLYLNSLPWDRKGHDTLKVLGKMKNVRHALQFFAKFPPGEIAAMKAAEIGLDDATAGYETHAGTLVEIDAKILRIETLQESITLNGNTSSEFISLAAGDNTGSASLLVAGALPEGTREGDTLNVKCIPIYLYSPKDGTGMPDIFFITIPALVTKPE